MKGRQSAFSFLASILKVFHDLYLIIFEIELELISETQIPFVFIIQFTEEIFHHIKIEFQNGLFAVQLRNLHFDIFLSLFDRPLHQHAHLPCFVFHELDSVSIVWNSSLTVIHLVTLFLEVRGVFLERLYSDIDRRDEFLEFVKSGLYGSVICIEIVDFSLVALHLCHNFVDSFFNHCFQLTLSPSQLLHNL